MTMFTEEEQIYNDLDWYAVDEEGRIGQFLTGGSRLLPSRIASNKEDLERLSNYFERLPFKEGDFEFCPDLEKNVHLYQGEQINEKFMPFSQKMASKGLFSYDSNDYTHRDRPYFRVAIPINPLSLDDLPEDIRTILENLRLAKICFAEDSLIEEEVTDKL